MMYNKLKQLGVMRYVSLVSAIVTLSAVASTATTFAAPKSNLYKICDDSGIGLCLKVQSANPPARPKTDSQVLLRSADLKFQNSFHAISVGKVTANATKQWPFIAGKGLNGKFITDDVFQIKYAPAGNETGQCLAVPDTYPRNKKPNTSVRVEPCSSITYWVYAGQNLVSVRATNRTNDQTKELLTGNAKNNAVVQAPTGGGNQKFKLGKI